ncbi:C-type lectin domain family 2 member D-like [Mauremys mutica]|uniref:C-type lectin domain-containing protein n=1 Tax=Mauremys mutica TaxID=74926 RepID=A0A9D3XM83_9SAUR|nr:C-type lectin domain family 2 member D-like [Mauremys mutica]XP_044839164.1 C-type lectin domain family 2 member D-like [Mauremys mutica]XP_044839166.1 C-type lectin domain family 2 member D-like [Mauremys mutica]KAH1183199.1 hypothetical protein KIL84_004691 [Mauremys mutica]
MLIDMGRAEHQRRHNNFSLKCIKDKWIPITVTVVITALVATIIWLAAKMSRCPSYVTAACPDGWVGYQGKCYYFSGSEGSWSASQNNCSSLGASLAVIDSKQDLEFMLRYKEPPLYWIGLRRDSPGQPWKWTNGTEFNKWFQIGGDGSCAYLNNPGVSCSQCYSERRFICSQPDVYARGNPNAAGEDSTQKLT